jgi:predicted SprT family Zn-dependent metalloprotease
MYNPQPPLSDPILSALRDRGAPVRAVRYRANRSVLLSISRDGRTLNSHVCFRDAPPEIAADIARWVTRRRGSPESRRALARLRDWEGTRRGLTEARRQKPRRRRPSSSGPSPAELTDLFDRLNRTRFDASLPPVSIRVSHRMTRSLGTIRYGEGTVTEIAISADLLLPANRGVLEDTMLHEMAHAEAWLRHGQRGHGTAWRRIAERVGCTPRALTRTPVRRRRRRR